MWAQALIAARDVVRLHFVKLNLKATKLRFTCFVCGKY